MKLELTQVVARHPAARSAAAPALNGVSLRVAPGEQLAVIGPSGAGKTTLLQVAAAALKPHAGEVGLDGDNPWRLRGAALQRLRGRLFLAPQTPPLPPRQRVVTAVLAGNLPVMGLWRSLRSLFYPVDIPAAHAALDRFAMADKLFERVDRLSGGERQRVSLARTLLAPASLWLVDEPLSALDPTRAQQALDSLRHEARARGATLLTSLHQVEMAVASFPRIVGLRDGEIAFDLPAAEVTPERLARLYAQHEDELTDSFADEAASPATTADAVPMNCR
jgi:phosphonate transport system ATP-binding protein